MIRCDGCGKDLTFTTNTYDYRLVLRAEEIPRNPACKGLVTDMHIPPGIERDHYFCDKDCVVRWQDPVSDINLGMV